MECVCVCWCGCVCVLGRTRSMSAYSNEVVPYTSAYESMDAYAYQFNGCVCVPVQWLRMQPYLSRFLWTFLVMSAYSNECCPLYVRIWVNGCVYGWRVGAYMDDLWVRMKPYLSRFVWPFLVMSAYSNEYCPLCVRIWVNGCVYGWLVGAYRLGLCVGVGLGLGVNNAYKSVWCVSTK